MVSKRINISRLISSLLMACFSIAAFSQKISFDRTTVDNGVTAWKKSVTGEFKFKNKGRKTLFINEVTLPCGCTDVQWPRTGIQPGDEGSIKITYDGMTLGTYTKMFDVHTNVSEAPMVLTLKGVVSDGRHKGGNSAAQNYPYMIGDIMLSTDNVEFPDVHSGDTVKATIEIMNAGSDVYTPVLMHLPPYLTATARPAMLSRGRKGVIELTLDSRKLINMGLNQTSVYLARYSGDKVSSENEISVSSVLLPQIPEYMSDAFAPVFSISATELNVGDISKKKKVSGVLTISNNGKGTLKLSAIEVFNQAISVQLPKRELLPGEKIKMKIKLDVASLAEHKAAPKVLIITNDPNHTKETVSVVYTK